MSKTKSLKRKFSSVFKSQVAIEALRERHTTSELSRKFDIHPSQINSWKRELINNSSFLFETKLEKDKQKEPDLEPLYSKIGKLEMERDYLKKSLKKLGWIEK